MCRTTAPHPIGLHRQTALGPDIGRPVLAVTIFMWYKPRPFTIYAYICATAVSCSRQGGVVLRMDIRRSVPLVLSLLLPGLQGPPCDGERRRDVRWRHTAYQCGHLVALLPFDILNFSV